jgi:hypothetical protein
MIRYSYWVRVISLCIQTRSGSWTLFFQLKCLAKVLGCLGIMRFWLIGTYTCIRHNMDGKIISLDTDLRLSACWNMWWRWGELGPVWIETTTVRVAINSLWGINNLCTWMGPGLRFIFLKLFFWYPGRQGLHCPRVPEGIILPEIWDSLWPWNSVTDTELISAGGPGV